MSIETMDIIIKGSTILMLMLTAGLFIDYIIDHLKDEQDREKHKPQMYCSTKCIEESKRARKSQSK